MNFVFDIGNSRTKIGIFDNNKLLFVNAYNDTPSALSAITKLTEEYPPENAIIACVNKNSEELELKILSTFNKVVRLLPDTPLPINIDYLTPETLGVDRIGAACGAVTLYPNQEKLIIDAGTAITFDYIDQKNVFRGGNISPGLQLRFKALHSNTGMLPLLSPAKKVPLLGNSTSTAIISGVQIGIQAEFDFYVNTFRQKHPEILIILTGGDSNFFANTSKKFIFVQPNLVLLGYNCILNHNVEL